MSSRGWHRFGRGLQIWTIGLTLFIFGLVVLNLLHARWLLLIINAIGLLFAGITWHFAGKIISNAEEMRRLGV